MTTTTNEPAGLSTDHSRAVADSAHSHGVAAVPETSRAARRTSFDVADFPVPTGREEEWRFSPMDRLAPLVAADGGVLTGHGVLTTVVESPEVRVEIVDRDDERLGQAGKPGDRIAAASWASFPRSTVVTFPREAVASQVTDLQGQQAALQAEEEKLTLAAQRLQAKVDAFRVRKETIKAGYTAAEAQTRIGEAVSGISEEMGDVGMAMQRAQDRTEQLQARAGALDELLASGALEDATLPAGRDDLQAELDAAAQGSSVEAELERMKAELPAPPPPPSPPSLGTAEPPTEAEQDTPHPPEGR